MYVSNRENNFLYVTLVSLINCLFLGIFKNYMNIPWWKIIK